MQKIATTLAAGGPGGNPYGPLSCSPGVYANGISPSTNPRYGLLGAQLLCSDSINPALFAGPLPDGQDLHRHPPDVRTRRSHGRSSWSDRRSLFDFRVVERIGPQCQPIGGGEATFVPAAGGGIYPDTDMPFSLTCPGGQAVTGVVGGVGEVVDSIALVCSPTTPTITSASPSTLAEFQYVTLTGTNLPATADE